MTLSAGPPLITQQLAQQLRLKKHRIITTLSEVQDITAGISKYSTSFLVTTISSPNEDLHAIACSNRTKGFDRPSHTDHKVTLPWNFLHDITLEIPISLYPEDAHFEHSQLHPHVRNS